MRVAKGYLYYKSGPNAALVGLFARSEANPAQPGYRTIVFDKKRNQLGGHEEVEAREVDDSKKERWQLVMTAATVVLNSAPRGVVEARAAGTFGDQEQWIGGFPPAPHDSEGLFVTPLKEWDGHPVVPVVLGWVPR